MAACFGSGGRQVARDEKFSAENDSGDEEEEEEESKRKAGAERAGEATRVRNRENSDGGMEARAETGRQAGRAGTPAQNSAGAQAEDQSCLPSLPGSPPRRCNTT